MINKSNYEYWQNVANALQTEIAQFKAQNAAPVDDWPMSVEDLPEPDRYYMIDWGGVRYMDSHGCDSTDFATETDVKSAHAFAQLSRLIRHVNKGWEPDFENHNEDKFTIVFDGRDIVVDARWGHSFLPKCLHFKNRSDAERSKKTHRALWLDYIQHE